MRIAIDARLVSYVSGGISQYTVRLVRALAAISGEDDILLLESRKGRSDPGWPAAARRYKLATPPHHRFEQSLLPLELLRVGAELLHSPDFIPPFRRRCRSVITIHDLAFLRFPHLLTEASARYYGQVGRAVESADQIIAVSGATRDDLVALLAADRDKITVVHEAADASCRPLSADERQVHRARLNLPGRYVLFVGTLEPRKNLPTLLRAFARVWADSRIPLVVVGEKGWLYEEVFKAREELGLQDAALIVGQVPAGELVYYYNCADLLVLPSLYEGFGLPVLEAMACGTPAIVSNVSSLPEVAGDAALTVDPLDIEGLAEAMATVLSDEDLRAKLIRQGIARASAFSWDRAAQETLSVYRRACG